MRKTLLIEVSFPVIGAPPKVDVIVGGDPMTATEAMGLCHHALGKFLIMQQQAEREVAQQEAPSPLIIRRN